ncbi:MAG TPA: hypothetical protein RMG95_13745 [Polyangiaceae bacterium LLY-WYZ-15_(1-7)]|nr:hypothetical protein [Polyangiaceae bacterium LLY-WYZ-15_(1-7)]
MHRQLMSASQASVANADVCTYSSSEFGHHEQPGGRYELYVVACDVMTDRPSAVAASSHFASAAASEPRLSTVIAWPAGHEPEPSWKKAPSAATASHTSTSRMRIASRAGVS